MRTFHSQIDLFDLLRDPAVEEGSAARDAGTSPSLVVPDRVQIPLLPKGEFKHEEYGDLSWTDEKFARMQQNFRAGVTGSRPPLNADHASQNPFAASAPAYGWFEDLVVTPHGLDAVVDLTRLGKEAIEQKLYRYISAEVAEEHTSSTGASVEDVVAGGALTNYPFHDTMRGLFSAKPQARCFSQTGPATFWAADQPKSNQGGSMTLLEKIREKFKLPATASEDDALAAVAALEAVEPPEAAAEEETEGTGTQQLAVTVETLDLSKHPAMLAMQRQVEEMATKVKASEDATAAAQKTLLEKDAGDAVEAYVRAGKIAPAQRETALRFALGDPVLFKAHYEHAPTVVDFKARGFNGDGQGGGGTDLGSQIRALQQANPDLDFLTAAEQVQMQNPDLYEQHRQRALKGGSN